MKVAIVEPLGIDEKAVEKLDTIIMLKMHKVNTKN